MENLTFDQPAPVSPRFPPPPKGGVGIFGESGSRKVPFWGFSGIFGNGNGPHVVAVNYRQIYKFAGGRR